MVLNGQLVVTNFTKLRPVRMLGHGRSGRHRRDDQRARNSRQQADQTFSDPATVSLRSASWPIGSCEGLSSRTHHNAAVTRSVQR